MSDQDSLTILGKQHQVRFPMTRLSSLVNVGWAPIDRHSVVDMIHRATAFMPAPAALALAPWKVMAPAVVLGAADLGVDKSVDRFITDHRPSGFLSQASGNLSRRPTLCQSFKHRLLKIALTQQPTSPPMSAFSLLLGVCRLITHLVATVTFKLARYSRWRAIHSCRDLADCFPGLAKSGKRTALFKRKLFIASSHCNTLYKKCCTWSVNLRNPGCITVRMSLDTRFRRYDGIAAVALSLSRSATRRFKGEKNREGKSSQSLFRTSCPPRASW